MDGESLSEFFDQQSEFDETGLASSEDIFSVLEALEGISEFNPITPVDETGLKDGGGGGGGDELVSTRKCKRQKVNNATKASSEGEAEANNTDGQQKISHITVERNRRKQMNGHLTILRSLMPCFYVKRGDQASIIGGVVDYISELQQVLQSLEAKKQRKVYSEVLSPRLISPLSPRKPPLSPRILTLPISPRTPQPTSPYKPWLLQPQPPSGNNYLSPTMANHPHDPSPSSSTNSSSIDTINELVANSRSAIADVEVRFSGPNVLLKTISQRIPGHAVKIISALEDLSLEVLHVNINTIEERMLNSFTIKIGIECQLSADELAHLIQQTFLVT